jgi:diguanylate cyclase (GGDEF)-like protein/PAS domain S-box-containing protein
MIRRFLYILLLVCGTQLARSALAAESADPGTLRIGVLVYRGLERAVSDWQPHADHLTKRLAPVRFEIVPLTLAEFAAAVAEKRIDLLITNTGHYVELEASGTVARIATMRTTGPQGPVDRFGGTLIVRAGREDIRGYGDLRGKRLAVPDTNGFGGWQVHLPEAQRAGINLKLDPSGIIETKNQEKVVTAVLSGEADAGLVRSDLIESLAAAGKLKPDALQVVSERKSANFPYAHSTQLYPHWPFARLDHVPEEIARNLLIALLELPPAHPAARAAGIYGWTLPHNYQSVHELFLEFRLGPYANMPVRFDDVMSRYGKFILISGALFIALLLASLVWILRVNLLLRNSKDKLQLAAGVFEHAQEGIIITDAKGNIIEANDTFLAVTGYLRKEVIGHNPRFLSSGKQDKDFYRDMWRLLREKGFWRGELWNRRKDGSSYVQQTSISAVRDEDGEIRHFIGLSSDISELKESQSKLEHMAYFDALTGLPNRRMLSDRLHQAIALAQRNERLLAVCYLDLDGFKPINDSWGHAAGDRLLVEVASRLMSCVRGGDTVCRLGGDEFVVLLGNLALLDECEIALDRMREALCAPFSLPDGVATLSASIGVTLFPMDGADPDTLIRHADQAMYASKLAGRNRYTLFDIEYDQLSEAKQESRQGIQRGLDCNEFVLYYQPKVNMRTGVISGAEALIRWQHPERGLLQPADFLPVVDFVGMQSEIGLWVLETALRQMEAWHAQGLDIVVSVNIAAQQLQSEGFLVSLREVMARHPDVPAVQLELEILETAALDDLTRVAEVIKSCHEMGVQFALDDFGTGYSSLTYLKQLKADTLKIDQSFIRDMLDDPEDLAIVDGIVGLASAFRREVVAEGVETPAHGRMLLQLGCEAAQGYGIAKPMAADQFPAWLHSWRQPDEWRGVSPWPREDLPLLTVEVDHLRWVRQFVAALQTEGAGAAHWPQLDHQECRFGLWLKHSGKAKYGNLAAFECMAATHAEVHVVGADIVQDYEANPARARERVHEIHACRDQLLGCLAALRSEARLPAA